MPALSIALHNGHFISSFGKSTLDKYQHFMYNQERGHSAPLLFNIIIQLWIEIPISTYLSTKLICSKGDLVSHDILSKRDTISIDRGK